MYLALAETFVNGFALFMIALGIGVLTRFAGPAGTLGLIPALNIFGFPMSYAVGTGIVCLLGRAIMDTFREGSFTNPDFRRGILLGLQIAAGVSIGKVILLTMADANVTGPPLRWFYIVVLLAYGLLYTFGRRGLTPVPCPRLAPLLPLAGVTAGILMGLTGMDAALLALPALAVAGLKQEETRATAALAGLLATGWGAFTFSFGGRVEVAAVILILLGMTIGEQVGLLCQRRVPHLAVRPLAGAALAITGLAVALKQFGLTTPGGYLVWAVSLLLVLFVFIRALVGSRRVVVVPRSASDRGTV
ncbi:MAG: sulfite exporter TauE/SafE family protein [Bacillota bacterium]|nr:sulfite exporter TauE/SafE family protein [Bacillota bacterium]